jgi:hypothetical protein
MGNASEPEDSVAPSPPSSPPSNSVVEGEELKLSKSSATEQPDRRTVTAKRRVSVKEHTKSPRTAGCRR